MLVFLSTLVLIVSPFSLYLSSEYLREDAIILNDELQQSYDDTTFNQVLTCTNGELKIIQFGTNPILKFTQSQPSVPLALGLSVTPNAAPIPLLMPSTDNSFQVNMQCPSSPSDDNYFNKVTISVVAGDVSYAFSFLLSCDSAHRHKKFQIGYVLLILINAGITLGVGLRSRIYSLRWRGKVFRVELTWKRYLVLTMVVLAMGGIIFFVAEQSFKLAFVILRYMGCVFAAPFVFVSFNQLAYRVMASEEEIVWVLRKCDLLSLGCSVGLVGVSLVWQNWVLFNVLAVCICVGSIKLMFFRTLKQAYASMAISVVSVMVVAVFLHYVLTRSYNDYASELSSPLFLQLPDMIDNLYKKCSWLPVLDIVVPGVCLSLLRDYDINYGTQWGGVYTLVGNFSFVAGSLLWILIEKLYPFSVPFCSITYPILMLSVILTAVKRNEHFNLWFGWFNPPEEDNIQPDQLKERASYSKNISSDWFSGALISGEYVLEDSIEQKVINKSSVKEEDKLSTPLLKQKGRNQQQKE